MTRIPSCPISASIPLLICSVVLGCISGENREDSPRLIVSPASATEGELLLPLTLSANGINLKKCANAVDSITFKNEKGPAAINVLDVEPLALRDDSVHLYVSTEIGSAGEYEVAYACNASTTLLGTFIIHSIPQKVDLTLSPSSVQANMYDQRIELVTEVPFFEENIDVYVLFGSGAYVTVREQRRIDDHVMEVIIDVDAQTPKGVIDVSAVKGDHIASGKFEILSRIKSLIYVSPTEVERQGATEFAPPVHDLEIYGDGIDFLEVDTENGITEEDATKVSFPDDPSIRVTRVDVAEKPVNKTDEAGNTVVELQKVLDVSIVVDKLAMLRATPLRVKTGDTTAWTNLSIKLPPDEPYLKIENQKPVPPNGEVTVIYARAVNFEFVKVHSVKCLEPGCEVERTTPSTSSLKKMNINVVVDRDYEETFATLVVATEAYPDGVEERFRIGDKDEPSMAAEPSALVQGMSGKEVEFSLTGDVDFESDITLTLLPRSGLKMTKEGRYVDSNTGIITSRVEFDVAPDAPTGPAYIQIASGGKVYVAPLYIQPSGQVPVINLVPGTTLRKRNTMKLNVTTDGWNLLSAPENYRFDDPGLQVTGVALSEDDPASAILDVSVSPAARTDMSVLYVQGEQEKAAATFRVLDPPVMRVVHPETDTVIRGGSSAVITVKDEGVRFGTPGVSIPNNIGLAVGGPQGGEAFVFSLSASKMDYPSGTEYTRGGWVGLVLDHEFTTYLLRVFIDAENDDGSLTAVMSPASVPQGSRNITVTARLPEEMTLELSELDVQSDLPGTFVANPVMIDSRTVTFSLDVTYSATGEIPIFIITGKGAAVGMVEIEDLEKIEVLEQDPWLESLSADAHTKVSVDPGNPPPSLLYTSSNWPDHADVTSWLVSENDLDIADTGVGGSLWITGGDKALVDVIAHDDSLPSNVTVVSRGYTAVRDREDSPDELDGYEWPAVEDPCSMPFLGRGKIDGAMDVDHVLLEKISCPLAAVAVARGMADRPWDTPDLWMELRDSSDGLIDEQQSLGWPTLRHSDPRLLIQLEMHETVVAVGAELGSAGEYFLNIRNAYIISEFGRSVEAPYIELEMLPYEDLTGLELILIDIEYGTVLNRFDFTGLQVNNDGLIVVAGASMYEADVIHPVALLPATGPFLLALQKDGVLMDSVQIGGEATINTEGTPIDINSEMPVFYRPLGLDTNNNSRDFLAARVGTPGV